MDAQKNEWWHLGKKVRFNYVANPTPYIKHTLEQEYGPLDFNARYI